MKLKDVLAVISGGTRIEIYADLETVFSGKMAEITKTEWDQRVGSYMDREVYRINTVDGLITLAV